MSDGTKIPMDFKNGHYVVKLSPSSGDVAGDLLLAKDNREVYMVETTTAENGRKATTELEKNAAASTSEEMQWKFQIGEKVKISDLFWDLDPEQRPEKGYFTGEIKELLNKYKSTGSRNRYRVYFSEDATVETMTEKEILANLFQHHSRIDPSGVTSSSKDLPEKIATPKSATAGIRLAGEGAVTAGLTDFFFEIYP